MSRYPHTLAILLLFCACGSDHESIKPTVGPITESVYANGVVKARGQYNVFPTVNGTVTALLVEEGDTVKAGQPLLRIDDRTSSLLSRSSESQLRVLEQNANENGPVLAQLKEGLAQAQEKLTLDSTNYTRQQTLWAQQIGSKNELDQRELAYTTSKAARNRAAKALEESRNRLRTELDVARNNAALSNAGNDDRTPRSLIDGIVYDLKIEPGELSTTQRPIAIIGSATDLYLQLEVDEKDIALVKPGQEVLVSLELFDGHAFHATVTRIVPIMDERSRTFMVEAEFKEKPPTLFPNLTAEASIVLRVIDNALTVPAGYVIDDGYVLTGPEERTPVRLGARDLQRVEVIDGIDSTTVLYKP
ncbi:MAG: efflux RND transporter periplasmic adaptor subunit [Flavobacteriales bacterium]